MHSETSQTRRFKMLPCRQRVAVDLAPASRIASPVGTLLRGAKSSERGHRSDLDLCRYRCRIARVIACVVRTPRGRSVDWKNESLKSRTRPSQIDHRIRQLGSTCPEQSLVWIWNAGKICVPGRKHRHLAIAHPTKVARVRDELLFGCAQPDLWVCG